MKFIVLTNPGLDNNFVEELIASKLKPCLIVTDSPFYCRRNNILKFLLKKLNRFYRYIKNKKEFEKKYQAYFLAKKYHIPFYPSHRVNTDDFVKLITDLKIDYGFVFTFKILKEKVFSATKFGFINFHPALLPFNRGASPSNFVILNNQDHTGVTFHLISNGIDNGSIVEQFKIHLSGFETAKVLNQYLLGIGSFLFVKLIYKLLNNYNITLIKNDISQGSYEPPFRKEHSIINKKNSIEEISNVIRASRIINYTAIFKYNGKEYNILNCVDMSECKMKFDNYPYFDKKNNIYLKLHDKKVVLLITKNNL